MEICNVIYKEKKMKNENTAKLSDALIWVKKAMEHFQKADLTPEERKQAAENLKLTTLASQTVVNACNVVARVSQVTGSKSEAKNVLGDL